MCQPESFKCDLCGKEFSTHRSMVNHKSIGHQDPIKRFISLDIVQKYKITEDHINDHMRASIQQLKIEKVIKPWDWENICRLILKPSQDLYKDYKSLKSTKHHSLKWYIILYGESKGVTQHKSYIQNLKSINPAFAEHYVDKGITLSEAQQLAQTKRSIISKKGALEASKKLKGSSAHTVRSKDYWIKKGFTAQEAQIKVNEIQNTRSIESYIRRHGNQGKILYQQTIDKWIRSMRISRIAKGDWICPSQKSEWENYRRSVINATKQSYKNHLERINLSNLPRGKGWELDNRYSVAEGFKNNVDPKIIGHWTNLDLINDAANASKWTKCSITLDQLLENYNQGARIY